MHSKSKSAKLLGRREEKIAISTPPTPDRQKKPIYAKFAPLRGVSDEALTQVTFVAHGLPFLDTLVHHRLPSPTSTWTLVKVSVCFTICPTQSTLYVLDAAVAAGVVVAVVGGVVELVVCHTYDEWARRTIIQRQHAHRLQKIVRTNASMDLSSRNDWR